LGVQHAGHAELQWWHLGFMHSHCVVGLCCVYLLQESWAEQIRAAGFKAVTYENLTGGIVAIHSGFKL